MSYPHLTEAVAAPQTKGERASPAGRQGFPVVCLETSPLAHAHLVGVRSPGLELQVPEMGRCRPLSPPGVAFPATATVIPGLGLWSHDPDKNRNRRAGRHCPEGCELRQRQMGKLRQRGASSLSKATQPISARTRVSLLSCAFPPCLQLWGSPPFPAEGVGGQANSFPGKP